MASQNIFNNLHMVLHSWNSAIEEVVFTFEDIYICRVSCLRFYSAIFDNNNTISSIYSFRYCSLPITAHKCLCPDDVIFMLVLSNIVQLLTPIQV